MTQQRAGAQAAPEAQAPPPPVAAAPPQVVYVIFDAEISQMTTEALLATMAQCANNNVRSVCLAISTSGGDVTQGIVLYNALRAMPFELVTHNIGNVDSIGNAIFLAGSRRYAAPHSTFMFHGVTWNLAQQTSLTDKQVLEIRDSIEREHVRIGKIIEERTQIAAADIPELFREAVTKHAADAIDVGIVHEIRDFEIPQGCPVVSLTFKR